MWCTYRAETRCGQTISIFNLAIIGLLLLGSGGCYTLDKAIVAENERKIEEARQRNEDNNKSCPFGTWSGFPPAGGAGGGGALGAMLLLTTLGPTTTTGFTNSSSRQSETSGCKPLIEPKLESPWKRKVTMFMGHVYLRLQVDVARGDGEVLQALTQLMGCSAKARSSVRTALLRHGLLLSPMTATDDFTASEYWLEVLLGDQMLKSHCQLTG